MTKRRRYLLLLLFILTGISPLVFAEIYIRLCSPAGYITPEILNRNSLHYVAAPFSESVFPRQEQDIVNSLGAQIHINAIGYRGPNFELPKRPGTIRIVFYGGSSVFDIGASEGGDWPHRVESIFKEKGFSNIEVINAGIPGHSSFDSFGYFFTEGHLLEPDYAVLYDTWNDIKYFSFDDPPLRRHRPYRKPDNPLLNYRNPVDRFLCEISQLYVRLRYRYYCWRFPFGLQGRKAVGTRTSRISPTALRQYRLNLAMFVELANQIGAVPVLMTEARLLTKNMSASQKARTHYEYHLLTPEAVAEAYEKSDEIIRQIASEKGVSLVDAARSMNGRDELFIDEVHLSLEGSEELARVTAEEISKLLET